MKNKIFIIITILFQLILINKSFSNEIDFQATDIEISNDQNITIANNATAIIKDDGIAVKGKKIKYFKDKSFEIFKDPEIPNLGYFGSDLNPYEVVFFKNLRFPHSQRGEEFANISSNNKIFLDSIISLKEIRN